MNVAERIQIMEGIGDSLAQHQTEIESPQWHYEVLEQRKKKIEQGEAQFLTLEELAARRKCKKSIKVISQ